MTGPGERRTRKLRLFFALWPGDEERAALWEAVRPTVAAVDGKPVPPGNFHVTLAFLGSVRPQAFAQLVELGGRQRWPAVSLSFTYVEYWTKPRVLVAMPDAVSAAGLAIVDGLWQGLVPLGFAREARPWQPHLTLVRRIRRPPSADLHLKPAKRAGREPPWRLALVESTTHPDGARYRPLADWPLAG